MGPISGWKHRLNATRKALETDPLRAVAERTFRVGFDAGFVADILGADLRNLPRLTRVLASEGLHVGAVHKLHALLHPERLALVDDDRALTYAEAEAEIERLTSALTDRLGAGPGLPVMLMMQNRVEYILLWMALIRVGAPVVHASWRQTADELVYQLKHSSARIVFADASARKAVESATTSAANDDLVVISLDEPFGTGHYQDLLSTLPSSVALPSVRPVERPGAGDETSGNIVYTSGTTGRPKGALRDLTAFGLVEFFRILERLPVEAGDRHLIVAPLYHSGAQVFAMMHAALGATMFIASKFEAEATLAQLCRERIHSIFLVPTMLKEILELPPDVHAAHRPRALRAIVCGAAPFVEALRIRAIARFGVDVVHDFYGATELGWVTLIDGNEMLAKPGSVGRPLAGQRLCIMDHDGHKQPAGATGLIYVRNSQTMAGYLGHAAATTQLQRQGWTTVEDLGYVDDDGYLYVVGRARDMVITGGVNVYPAEVEEALAHHEAVADVAVVGIEDETYGEALVAFVVLRRPIAPHELEAYARQRLSSYKVPRRWHVLDALPRNPTGKVLKHELAARFTPGDE
jgi:fatty-acyl-CoA synthase